MLRIKALSKVFKTRLGKEKLLLKDISITFEPGKLIGVIGANGSGKSTFFKMISGEEMVEEGQLFLDKKSIGKLTAYQRSSFLTQVKQNPVENVFLGLTVYQNMVLASKRGKVKGLQFYAHARRKKAFYEKLERYDLGLERFMDEPVDILSGGQKQALAVIMATLAESEIILFDEHCSALDPNMTKKIMDLTQQIVRSQNLIGLMITHDIHYALSHSDAYVILKNHSFTKFQKPTKGQSAEAVYRLL